MTYKPRMLTDEEINSPIEQAGKNFMTLWAWFLVPILVTMYCEDYRAVGGVLSRLFLILGSIIGPFSPLLLIFLYPTDNLEVVIYLAIPCIAIWLPTIINALAGTRLIPGWSVALSLSAAVLVWQVSEGYKSPGGHFG